MPSKMITKLTPNLLDGGACLAASTPIMSSSETVLSGVYLVTLRRWPQGLIQPAAGLLNLSQLPIIPHLLEIRMMSISASFSDLSP